MPGLMACLCGSTAAVGESTHRTQARAALDVHYKELAAQPQSRSDVQRAMTRASLAQQGLAADHVEVACATCGRWVHAATEESAIVLWNKAIDKLAQLQACCRQDYERREDYDGMVMHVCTSAEHDDTIHGRRYLPMEPAETYDVKPSDAAQP